jgi:anaerobic dimethyl sulfoxide reductase subunit C (anchor subunit)
MTTQWPLIAFTILAQMSVGSFIMLGVSYFFAKRKYGVEHAELLSDRALLAIGPVLGLGLIATFFHLGEPIIAYLAVVNVDTSWLSREILFGVSFAVVGGIFAVMQWRKIGTPQLRNVIAWIAALLGLAMVFSMSSIYLIPAMPAWNTVATPISFFVTTFLLGAFALGAALVANYSYLKRRDPDCAEVQCAMLRGVLRWTVIISVLLLGVEILILPVQIASLVSGRLAFGLTGIELFASEYWAVFALRLILVFVGVAVLGVFIYKSASSPGQEQLMGNLAYLAFGFVLVAEVMGRFLFYATNPRVF